MVTVLTERIRRSGGTRLPFLIPGALTMLFVLAFCARLVGVTLFVTPDEDNWMRRAGNFAEAVHHGELTRTFQSGHPGVTTMWVAWIGMGPDAERLAGVTTPDHPVTRTPGFMDLLVRARLAMILVNVVLVVGIVALMARLAGSWPAIVGGVILALDPFLVAHQQVVHVDGFSAGFMTVAMLSAGVYWLAGGRPGYLVLCGLASGLAVLTKAPSLVLGLLIPVVAMAAIIMDRRTWSVRRSLGSLMVAGIIGVLVIGALWPTFWVAPVETVERFITFTLETSSEHRPGNFFLGQAVADPGVWFYPVAILFRLSPLALAGLVALGVLLPPPKLRRQSLLLTFLVIGFIMFLSLAGKKLDRYTLPAFPGLDLLAGLGLWTLGLWSV
ncbi:MAG: glycosyltransferase family 39 protein, partial [Chloroflexota bacterium]